MKFTTLNRYNQDVLHTVSYNNGSAAYFSLANNGESINEDALMLADAQKECRFLLVADGMGGHPGGDEAAEIILEMFKKKYARSRAALPNQKLFQTLDDCNQAVIAHEKDTGSTLCMCLIEADTVQFFCVGDSLGIVLDKDGEVRYATMEENSVAIADEIGVAPKESFLLNYIGFERISYQVSPRISFAKGDQLFLMTDGAHEFFEQGDEKNQQRFVEKLIGLRTEHRLDDATYICFTK